LHEPESADVDGAKTENVGNRDFTQSEFNKVWRQFAENERKKRPRLGSLMLEQVPELLLDDFIVKFYANSEVQKGWLDKNVHNELEGYLRANLHNAKISLRFMVQGAEQEGNDSDTPYTSQEKFNYMLEKSEALQMLRDVFGLKTD